MSVLSHRKFYLAKPAMKPLAPPVPAARPLAEPVDRDQALAMALLRDGTVPAHAILSALAEVKGGSTLVDILLAGRQIGPERLYAALAEVTGLALADFDSQAPDARLIDRLGAEFCFSNRLLPWRDCGGLVVVATAHPDGLSPVQAQLLACFGPVVQVLAPQDRIEAELHRIRGSGLIRAAELKLDPAESCRDFPVASPRTLALLATLAALSLTILPWTVTALLLWSCVTLAAVTGLKLAALIATLRGASAAPANPPVIARLPMVSIMVALYKESDIASRLVRRLSRLDYPRDLLEILLVVEEEDHTTRRALARATLPPWFRTVIVPDGRLKTKPRALNYALGWCRGSIVGVYDAEDAPEADQIRKVVERFHQRGSEVACLQGQLDFYNPRHNWISRCFTVEYASWFRVVLPGLQRLGLPIPLGGTTLFFRRSVLEKLGGWDAHNVTEDADLGMRLARHGYRTEVIETTTHEEANCLALPWIKQRSRWVKGYMMTYITHMRRPGFLWRQLGPRGFLGFQILFVGSLSQSLLAPVTWSLLSLQLGLGHVSQPILGSTAIQAMVVLFLASEVVNVVAGVVGLKRSGQRLSAFWVPTLSFYFPFQTLAAYKAAWELLRRPFYWDKTSHGAFSQGTRPLT